MAIERDDKDVQAIDAKIEADRSIDAETEAEVEVEEADDGESGLFDVEADPTRPTVRPASAKSYGPPQRRSGAHVAAPKFSEPEVFGVSVRAIALIAAIAAIVSVFASLAVSCGTQSMLQRSIDSARYELDAHIDDNLASANSQIEKIIDDYNAAEEAASSAEEANTDLSKAREDLRQTIADARAWLQSGNGQWVGNQTKTMMSNAIDSAQNLVDESGITDPQTYRDAEAAINDIIDDVANGRLW